MTNLKSISQTVKVISLAVILSFGISLVYAWTAPTDAPPNGNSTAPLNTGAGIQAKDGTLVLSRNDGVAGIESFGKAAFATLGGLVGIGTASPWAKLTIVNQYAPNGPGGILDFAIGNTSDSSSSIALTNGLPSAEATISSTEGAGAGETDFRIATRSNGGFDPAQTGILTDRFVVDWDGTVGINTSSPTEALTVGGIIETKAGPGGASGIKFADGSVQTTASPVSLASKIGANPVFTNWLVCSDGNTTIVFELVTYRIAPAMVQYMSQNGPNQIQFSPTAPFAITWGGFGNCVGKTFPTLVAEGKAFN